MSNDYIVSSVVFGIIVVLLAAVAIGAGRDGERWSSIGSVIAIPIAGLVWFSINHPAFDMQYHKYQQISGTVTEIERDEDVRMFELKDDPRDLSCTESWCTKVEVGDTLTLDCIRDNEMPDEANVWECKFVKLKETDRV